MDQDLKITSMQWATRIPRVGLIGDSGGTPVSRRKRTGSSPKSNEKHRHTVFFDADTLKKKLKEDLSKARSDYEHFWVDCLVA